MTVGPLECRQHLVGIFQAAIAAVEPAHLVQKHLAVRDDAVEVRSERGTHVRWTGATFLIGAGKAAARMAAGCEAVLPHDRIAGLVVTADGCAVPLGTIECREAGHPLPDRRAVLASERMCALLSASKRPVLGVLSGGASSLLERPRPPATLDDMIVVNQLLLACGADIEDMNCVRKHLSLVKGGGLLRWTPRRPIVTLILSDVIGDDPAVIGSGPTAPDSTTYAQAIEVLTKFGLDQKVPPAVRELLRRGNDGAVAETLKPQDPALAGVTNLVIGSNRIAIDAATFEAERLGYRVVTLFEPLCGPTHAAASNWLRFADENAAGTKDRLCLVAGGETTVVVRGKGKGGRNQQFALELVQALSSRGFAMLSAGTDGVDGPTDAAGAFVDATSLDRARRMNVDPQTHLNDNDSYSFFDNLGDLYRCGPTGTNVMDIKIALRPAL